MLLSYSLLLSPCLLFFFFNDTATTEIYTLSLHDALPICSAASPASLKRSRPRTGSPFASRPTMTPPTRRPSLPRRSEEHTSELQSQFHLVCRLLLEKKKKKKNKKKQNQKNYQQSMH